MILKAPTQNGLACYVFAEAVEEAGLPPGVVNVLVADAAESEHLVTHPGVDKVSFTGSTPVGKRIAELCGRDIRRVTLELGGKSAAIMLDDVDVEKAVPGIIGCSVAMLQGEICTAQSRIIVPRSRYDEIVDAFAEQIAALPVGDPADRDKAIGPMITQRSTASASRATSRSGRTRAQRSRPAADARRTSSAAGTSSRRC